MHWIALDLGSTYTKAALMADGEMLRQLTRPTPEPLCTEGGRYEIGAEGYFAQVLSILEELRDEETKALFISTQMHGGLLTDESFRPITPYISWRDGVGAKHLGEIRAMLGSEAVAPAGVPLKGNLLLCALLGRRMEGETLPERARLCTLGGYMIGRLTGEYVCHMTNAAPTGLADVQHGCWNDALMKKAGLTGWQLPRVVSCVVPVGMWQNVLVYPDLGDQQVCAAGAALEPEISLHVSVGTAGLIGGLTSRWEPGAYESRPWLESGLYLRTVSGLPGGRHMAALARLIMDTAQRLNAQVTEEKVWAFLTSCTIPGQPCLDPWQRLGTGSPELFIASLYADLAKAYHEAAARLQLPIQRLAFSGGAAAKNAALRGAICRAFGCEDPAEDHDAMQGLTMIVRKYGHG